ncbi:LLM class flavin-dependent oxidoreductase [Rhabdothermincola salaria]|uniref:LLM class flavin-dependent oxidoreductase n=1 Tax=Rhabdothermincola salaria TaxID=2903142 RepID=UPI001E2F2D0E|nr:LLM class flavin-dependent oxidoreductase [Rhabdothermincola salaria]MCD9625227.1 LLM class flavin-dependent oxidoreductase [Rhabdothermincola salaria]
MTANSTPSVRFATGTTVTDFDWYRRWLDAAEGAGFEMLTTGDSQSLWADPFVILGVAAQHTTRPRLGLTVSNPCTRHPAVVASSLVALQQVSGGRMVYGFSSGDSALRNIGVPPADVATLSEFGRTVKGLCAGETVEYKGHDLVLRWGHHPTPVWMAAEGPRTQHLAGQIADGVVLSNALDAEVLSLARANIAAGAASVGRSIDDIEIWCMAAMCPAPSEAEGIARLRFLLAGTANHVYRFHTDGKGLPDEHRDAIAELQRRYDSSAHATPARAEANARLVEDLGLVDFLARRSVIAGPVERRIERIRECVDAGATNLILSQFVDDQIGFMDEFAAEIRPAFG